MTIDTSVTDFLSGGGGKSAKFETIGATCVGTITAAETRQQTDPKDGSPKTWDNGDPMMQLVITLQTDQREGDDDDGTRNVYVKGSKKPESQSGTAALIAALKAAGPGTQLEVGGQLAVRYTGDGTPAARGLSAPKHWQMQYKAPAIQTGGMLDDPAPAAQQAPAAAPAAEAAPADMFSAV